MKRQIMEVEVCSEQHHHIPLHVPQISSDNLYQLADLFKVFGDPTRLRILYTLSEVELCVCDIADSLSMTQSAISHQLRILKEKHLVKARRDGKTIFYSLADAHVSTIISQGLNHILE